MWKLQLAVWAHRGIMPTAKDPSVPDQPQGAETAAPELSETAQAAQGKGKTACYETFEEAVLVRLVMPTEIHRMKTIRTLYYHRQVI
jgi:hypothetical protein